MVDATITKMGESFPTPEVYKEIIIETDATSVTGELIPVTLADYFCTEFKGISMAQIHTTVNSVVVDEAPTTAVSAGVLTITLGGTTATGKRVYKVLMR